MVFMTQQQPAFFGQGLPGREFSTARMETENPAEQLESLGVDTGNIDAEVETEIEQTRANKLSRQKVAEILQNAPADIPKRDIIDSLISRGFILEGLNDQPGFQEQQEAQFATDLGTEEERGFFQTVVEAPGRTVGAGIARIPELIGNVGGFFIGKPIDALLEAGGVDAPSLEEQFKKDAVKNKEQMQEILGVDPEDFTTTIGELGTDVGSMFIPGGQSSLISKIPGATDKIRKLGTALNNLKTKAPAIFNTLKTGLTGAKEAGKFQVLTEGEISPLGLAFGATAQVGLDKLFKTPIATDLFNKAKERFSKLATKLSPSKAKKVVLDNEIAKGAEGAIIIRANNPDLILKGDDAVSNALEGSAKTRLDIFRQIQTARGQGVIDNTPVVSWIDDVVSVLQDPKKLSKFRFDKEFIKKFNAIDKIADTDDVIRALLKERKNIVSKGERTFTQWDDLIINRNNKLSNFFNQTGSDKVNTQVSAAIADKMKSHLDDSIGALGGQFRALKGDYGKVRTFEDNLNKIYAQLLRKKDSQIGDFADTFILSNMGSNLATGNFLGLSKDITAKLIKETIQKQNDPNFVLQTMFRNIDDILGVEPTGFLDRVRRGFKTPVSPVTEKATVVGAGEVGEGIEEVFTD